MMGSKYILVDKSDVYGGNISGEKVYTVHAIMECGITFYDVAKVRFDGSVNPGIEFRKTIGASGAVKIGMLALEKAKELLK